MSTDIFSKHLDAIIQTSLLEWLAVISALFYVILASKQNNWCWLAGNISVVLYTILCYGAQLYIETWLQIFYFVIGVYGWLNWKKEKETMNAVGVNRVYYLSFKKTITLLLIPIPCWLVISFLFSRYTQAAQPYLDSLIATYSILATWMTARKFIENWLLWIVVDALAIILYFNRGLYLSSGLYMLYCILAAYGYFEWKKSKHRLPA